MAGTVIIPWYATGFRHDDLEVALNDVAATALRYGASSYGVYRSQDDRYKFQQLAAFEEKLDWERYWAGPEMTDFRVLHSSWYQIPVLYSWWNHTAGGALVTPAAPNGYSNGAGNGVGGKGAPHPIEGESV